MSIPRFLPIRYSGQSQVYNDDRLYDAFQYDKRPQEGDKRKNSQENEIEHSSDGLDKNRYETDKFDKDRFETDRFDKDRYEAERFDKDIYGNNKYNKYNTHFPDRKPLDRYNTDRKS